MRTKGQPLKLLYIHLNTGYFTLHSDWKDQIASEIGDVLWYCAALANDLNMPLAMIANLNEKKLRDRFDRGKINGSGDNR